MNRAQISTCLQPKSFLKETFLNLRILEQVDEICLSRFLQSKQSMALPPESRITIVIQVCRHVHRNLSNLAPISMHVSLVTIVRRHTKRENGNFRIKRSVLF